MTLEHIQPRSQKYLSDRLRGLVKGRLWLQVLVGLALGVGTGLALGPTAGWLSPDLAGTVGDWLALPGHLFLVTIQMIVVPLVLASVIRGLAATEDMEQLRRMGLRAIAFFVVTTAAAATIGIILALVVQPGKFIESGMLQHLAAGSAQAPVPVPAGVEPVGAESAQDLPRRLLSLLPQNPLASMVEREMLQIVLFAIIVGVALVTMPPRQSKPLLDLFGSIQEVCITIVRWAMIMAPVAVFGLMAQVTSKVGVRALMGLGVYIGTVIAGLLIMLGIYLAIVFVVAGHRPLAFLGKVREVLLLAFSTSSSAAVMPLSIKTADEKLGVRPSVSQFIIPLGTTVNMNGTALYQAVATLFLAQLFGIDLTLGALTFIVIVAVASSIGAPATPGVGMVILATLLRGVGVPLTGIALVMGVDRLLDMSRTAVNVCGDLVACVVMDRWVAGQRSADQELQREAVLEKKRESSGEDVIVTPSSATATTA